MLQISLLGKKPHRVLFVGLLALVLVVAFNYWFFVRPTSVSQEFVRLVLSGQFDKAGSMVVMPCRMSTDAQSHHLIARDGSSCEIPITQVELHVFEELKQSSRNDIVDFLLCRKHFSLGAICRDEQGLRLVPIYCTTQGSTVLIEHVGAKE